MSYYVMVGAALGACAGLMVPGSGPVRNVPVWYWAAMGGVCGLVAYLLSVLEGVW